MNEPLALSCRCGALRGCLNVPPRRERTRVVCYCDDCQAYARRLGAEAVALDAHGGTEIVQLSPANVTLDGELSKLTALRLTARGPLRWYADCCGTPVGNTLATRQVPFVGLVRTFFDVDDGTLDAALGPIEMRVMTRFALGHLPASTDAYDGFPPALIARTMLRVARWRWRGDHRRWPFPIEACVARP